MAQKYRPEINTFRFGELTPKLSGRSDTGEYFQGCSTLENWIPYSYGGVTRRQGTRYIASAKNSSYPVRIIPFEYSTIQAYILEFGHQYMRVFKDGGIITVSGTPYYIDTEYDGYDLYDVDYAQSADVMYLAHESYKPKKLTRTGHSAWTITDVAFDWPPFLDENTTATTITPSSTTGNISLTASSALFSSYHVGSSWKIRGSVVVSGDISAEDTFISNLYVEDAGSTLVVSASNSSWGNTVATLQKTYDDGATWIDVIEFDSASGNISLEVAENNGEAYYTFGCKTGDYDSGPVSLSITLLNQAGYFNITSVANSTTASGTVVRDLPTASGTTRWSEGAWSDHRGYPGTVAFFEDRLLFGGNSYRPQTVWGSKVDDYENFDTGTGLDDDAYSFSLLSQTVNSIQWMIAADVLRIGTYGGEWKFGFTDEATTPTNVSARQFSSMGSEKVRPKLINGNVLFIQRGGRKLRGMAWDDNTKQYIAPEVSYFSEHLLNYQYGITDMTYVMQPDPILYLVRFVDGTLLSATYDPNNQVAAFSRIVTDGYFESVASIPGDDRDEVWTVVYRENYNGTFRAIEYFETRNWDRDNQEEALFVDSALSYSGASETTFSGLDHLEGLEVQPVSEGGSEDLVTVSGGIIELEYACTQLHVGLPYSSILETMDLNFPVEGSNVGRQKKIHKVAVKFQDTNYAKVGSSVSDTYNFAFRSGGDLMDEPIPLSDETHYEIFPKGYDKEVKIRIEVDEPLPCTVVSIAPVFTSGNL